MSKIPHLSRRERQIMDIVYEVGEVSSADVHERLEDPPSYSAVRATLRILEEKGHLSHKQAGQKYLFVPTVSAKEARESALRRIVRTFFGGSPESAMAALLDLDEDALDPDALKRLADLITESRKQGR